MDFLFNKCSSLSILPEISKWKVDKVRNINYIFSKCASLSTLPDLSTWNLRNVNNMIGIFQSCTSLTSIENFQKFSDYNSKITDECISLLNTK